MATPVAGPFCLENRRNHDPARDCRFSFAEVGFPAGGSYTVRDCWTATERKGLAAAGGYVARAVPHHGTALLRVSRTK